MGFVRGLVVVLGITLIIVGVLGIFLPFVQGLALIALGLVILLGKKAAMKLVKRWKKRTGAFFGFGKSVKSES